MNDSQILTQCASWRATADDTRDDSKRLYGLVKTEVEIMASTMEACAARFEKLVQEHPGPGGHPPLLDWREKLSSQHDFIVSSKEHLSIVQTLAKQLGFAIAQNRIDGIGWLISRLHQ